MGRFQFGNREPQILSQVLHGRMAEQFFDREWVRAALQEMRCTRTTQRVWCDALQLDCGGVFPHNDRDAMGRQPSGVVIDP
jgi:hypothetical protein